MSKKLNVKGASPRLEHLFEYFVYTLPKGDPKTRDRWADRIRSAASQPDFEFEPALRRFLVYALVGSKRYSALASVKKTSNPKKREVVNVIMRVAKDIRRGASDSQLNGAIKLAISALDTQKSYYSSYYDPNYETADNAIHVAYYAANSVQFKGQVPSAIAAYKVPPLASMAAGHAAIAATGRRSEYAAVKDPLTSEFAAALLYFVEQEAYGRGKRRGNPSTEKVPSLKQLLGRTPKSNPRGKTAKKKTVRKPKAGSAAGLVKECRRLWDHYCERPGKTRLKAVMKHCELMAESTAKSVKEERQRCMRAARREAKKLGM